jgi:predicted small lipoprotein YifL
MIRKTSIISCLFACLLLAACGQKGALYLPDEARPVTVPASTGTAATGADAGADAQGNADADSADAQRRRQQQATPANPAR